MRRHSNCAKRQRNHQRSRKSAAASGGAQRHQQAQPPPNPGPCELCRGVLGVPPAARRTCDQRAPVGACGRGQAGGQQTVRWQQMAEGQRANGPSCRQVGRHADQGQTQAGRACARGRHDTWRAPAALLAARVPPTLRTGCSSAGGDLGSAAGAPSGFPSWRSELWVEPPAMTLSCRLSMPAELGGRQHQRGGRRRADPRFATGQDHKTTH
eukprot:COSAG04_NODE_340_length_16315_cov_1278.534410_14_plen_211_part_00